MNREDLKKVTFASRYGYSTPNLSKQEEQALVELLLNATGLDADPKALAMIRQGWVPPNQDQSTPESTSQATTEERVEDVIDLTAEFGAKEDTPTSDTAAGDAPTSADQAKAEELIKILRHLAAPHLDKHSASIPATVSAVESLRQLANRYHFTGRGISTEKTPGTFLGRPATFTWLEDTLTGQLDNPVDNPQGYITMDSVDTQKSDASVDTSCRINNISTVHDEVVIESDRDLLAPRPWLKHPLDE